MKREEALKRLKNSPEWDLIIIGGGASGLGCAVDAASRGYSTLLLEQSDFAKGSSSRSTKLIHGGLRYLKQGNVSLVIEALHERGLLCQNAPHLVSHLGFLIPNYHWWEGPLYGAGIKFYNLLAGKLGLEKSRHLSLDETLDTFPTLEPEGLRGGTIYYDGQFDDARLAIALAQTAYDHGAVCLNYAKVTEMIKEKDQLVAVVVTDQEGGDTWTLKAKAIINATGIFSDQVRRLDEPAAEKRIKPSQGIHLVVDRSFFPSDLAVILPQAEDGRVIFFVPWHQHVLIGTTDTPIEEITLEPKPLEEEIVYLLKVAKRYLTRPLQREDVLSAFAGIRPLAKADLSRDHEISVSASGLISITGGKWTTYRKMAEDTIDKAIAIAGLKMTPCCTENLRLHGYEAGQHPVDPWLIYGSERCQLEKLLKENREYGKQLHPRLPYHGVEVVWAVRHEMARSLEDVLARRTRSLFLDARASMEIAPIVASIMAKELNRPTSWQQDQVEQFNQIAKGYLIRVADY